MDAPFDYRGCWVGLRATSLGVTSGGASDMQKTNAKAIFNLLRIFGYSEQSACGILGNMQVESGLSPAALQTGHTNLLPDNGEVFQSLTNAVITGWHGTSGGMGYGTGLIQWDSISNETPAGNVVGSFATRYNWYWYDWRMQIFRLEMEYIYDPSGWGGVNGQTYTFWGPSVGTASITWANFKTFTGTPEDAADYFRLYRERGGASSIQERRNNARYWYNYLTGTTIEWEIDSTVHRAMAYLFRNSGYSYSTYDCIGFTNLVRRRLGLQNIGNHNGHFGTNSLWRNTTGELYWKGTIQECIDLMGEIPPGAYLFKCYPEGSPGYNTIPEYYRNDGVGNFDHVGIYTNLGLGVMQSGGYDAGRTGVADCAFHPTQTDPQLAYDWWTHVALPRNIYFVQYAPSPGYSFRTALYYTMYKQKKRLLGSVKRS